MAVITPPLTVIPLDAILIEEASDFVIVTVGA